jgi:N-acetylneuraminic acid mutarotase
MLLAGLTGFTLVAPAVAAQVTAWRSLANNGLSDWVFALALHDDDLYVGGDFEKLGDGTDISKFIARYDTAANTWHSLSNGGFESQVVHTLALDGSDLYVGGAFRELGDGTNISEDIALYDTSTDTWQSLPNQGVFAGVMAMELDGTDLYVGGYLRTLGDGTEISDNIARYDISTGTWHSLPNGGLSAPHGGGSVHALQLVGTDLYVGGSFTTLGDGTDISDYIARYDTSTGMWHSLPNQGLNFFVGAMAVDGSDLYVGGTFFALGDGSDISDHIALYDTSTGVWHSILQEGIGWGVTALALEGSNLYVGGDFLTMDGTDISDNVALYNTSTGSWNSLSNDGVNGSVTTLALDGSDL